MEDILSDDGSTDKSYDIAEKCANTDKRIEILHGKNGGPSAARNRALEVFRGAYCTFVDADDVIDKFYIEKLYAALMKWNVEISVCREERCMEKELGKNHG